MEVQGKIKSIGKLEFIGSNGFEKREIVLTTEEQYPQDILIQFTQGRCALLDNLHIGETVKIYFNLQGREWISPQGEVRHFNSLNGWKIEQIQITEVSNQNSVSNISESPAIDRSVTNKTVPPVQNSQKELFDNFGQAPFPSSNQAENLDDLPY